jgi:hypothetical protein
VNPRTDYLTPRSQILWVLDSSNTNLVNPRIDVLNPRKLWNRVMFSILSCVANQKFIGNLGQICTCNRIQLAVESRQGIVHQDMNHLQNCNRKTCQMLSVRASILANWTHNALRRDWALNHWLVCWFLLFKETGLASSQNLTLVPCKSN